MRTFHDAVIVGVSVNEDELVFRIQNVSVYGQKPEHQETGRLIVKGLSAFRQDGQLVTEPTFDFDDGQILDINMDDNTVAMLLEWEDYKSGRTGVVEYDVAGSEVRWIVEPSSISSASS